MAQFTNQAQLSYNGMVINSNITVGEFLDSLTADKHAVTSTYTVGDEITYVISMVSTGTNAQNNITVTDDLGAYISGGVTVYPLSYVAGSVTYYQNGTIQPAPTVTVSAPLTITGITVPAGGSVIIIYKATVTQYANPNVCGTITNTATIDGACITTPIRVSETISAVAGASLTIIKSLEPTVVTGCGGRLTYTFTIRNLGNTAAGVGDSVILTDTFYPILHGLTATRDGVALPASAYTYSELNGVFTTAAGQIVVPAATYTQDPTTGAWTVIPGTTTIVVTGTV